MAMDVVSNWHNQLMAQERARVLFRIANGTKASSPRILNARREMPLFYSNPLPDNSSGSKNRPFFASKDESGRPTADQIVAMNQHKAHFGHEGMSDADAMRGGVLRQFNYAQQILKRRARDTENINLASQGLPAEPAPMLELSEVESRKLELDTLLQSLSNQIELGDITSLTVAELKNIPRLMVALAPVLTEGDITQLIRTIDNLLMELEESVDEETPRGKNAIILYRYLDNQVRGFLEAIMEIINLSPEDKALAVRQLTKEIFKLSPTKTAFPSAKTTTQLVKETPEGLTVSRKAPVKIRRVPPMGVAPEEEAPEAPAEAEVAPPKAVVRKRFEISDKQLSDLKKAYRNDDTDTLKEFMNVNIPRLRADKHFSSRAVMANRIREYLGIEIKK